MDLQGGSSNLQGGTGISQPGQPYTQPINVQPATGVDQYPSTSNPSVQGINTTAAPAVPDPYAAWGGKAAYDSLVSGFNTQDQNIHSTADEAAQSGALGLHSSIADFLYGLNKSQNAVNESAVQNELAKKQGYTSILDMVAGGLANARTMLGQRNVANGTAAEALARAYSQVGGKQGAKNMLQYTQGQRSVANAQNDLEAQRALGLGKISDSKTQTVNNIVLDARNKLAALDAQKASASLPDRIDIEAEQNQIRNSISQILSQYDQELASGNAGIAPTSDAARRTAASDLFASGAAPNNAFNLNTYFPISQPTTADNSLPLFIAPRKQTA